MNSKSLTWLGGLVMMCITPASMAINLDILPGVLTDIEELLPESSALTAPDPRQVSIKSISYAGTGCPAGTRCRWCTAG